MLAPIRGVNADNYFAMGKAFIGAQEKGFVIIRDRAWATHEFAHTPREWGAWMAYFDARYIKRLVFDRNGKGTVPARWPHQFDADWGVGNDEQSADMYEGWLAKETRSAATLRAKAQRIPYERRTYGITEAPEPEKPPQFIDKDLLMQCYDEDVAALEAKRLKAFDAGFPQPVDTRATPEAA